MVNVGIIGLGPAWESRYAPALRKLGSRIGIRAVYDPVASRAEQVASQYRAAPVAGVLALLDRADVRAVLVLDGAWHGSAPVRFACSRGKPAYVVGQLANDFSQVLDLHHSAISAGLTLMPELGRRYTPATARLRELMVTRIGHPRNIRIEVMPGEADTAPFDLAPCRDLLMSLLDWCLYVAGTKVVEISAIRGASVDGKTLPQCIVAATFEPSVSRGNPITAEIRIVTPSVEPPPSPLVHTHLVCEQGTATMNGIAEISWTAGSLSKTEALTSDRSDVEVMLDHFCRRVVGGLIPVADASDVCRGLILFEAAQESFRTSQPITLNGRLSGITRHR